MNLIPFIAFGILIVGFGLVLLARPSLYLNLRHVRNTFNPNLLNSLFYRVQTRAFGLVLTLFGLDLAFALARKASAFFATLQEVLHVTLFIVFFAIWIGTVLLWVFEKLKVIRPPLKERYMQPVLNWMCTDSIRRRSYFCAFWRESSSSRRSSRSWLRKFMGRDGQKAYNFELSLISVSRRQI